MKLTPARGVLSLAQLLEHNPKPTPALIEPAVLPASGILFVGGEPKVGKSLLVANLALALASGSSRAGFQVPEARRVLICQFELPTPQFAARLSPMRKPIGSAADSNLLVDTEAAGHLLSAPRGLDHFLTAVPPKPTSSSWIRSTPLMIRTKTIPAPWPPFARRYSACAMLLMPLSLLSITFENPSAVTRSAVPSAAPALFTPSAIPICCWSGLRLRCPLSSCVSSSAMLRHNLRNCSRWMPTRCGLNRPTPSRRHSSLAAKSKPPTSNAPSPLPAPSDSINSGNTSWTNPIAPAAPLSWPSNAPVAKALSCTRTINTVCLSPVLRGSRRGETGLPVQCRPEG